MQLKVVLNVSGTLPGPPVVKPAVVTLSSSRPSEGVVVPSALIFPAKSFQCANTKKPYFFCTQAKSFEVTGLPGCSYPNGDQIFNVTAQASVSFADGSNLQIKAPPLPVVNEDTPWVNVTSLFPVAISKAGGNLTIFLSEPTLLEKGLVDAVQLSPGINATIFGWSTKATASGNVTELQVSLEPSSDAFVSKWSDSYQSIRLISSNGTTVGVCGAETNSIFSRCDVCQKQSQLYVLDVCAENQWEEAETNICRACPEGGCCPGNVCLYSFSSLCVCVCFCFFVLSMFFFVFCKWQCIQQTCLQVGVVFGPNQDFGAQTRPPNLNAAQLEKRLVPMGH